MTPQQIRSFILAGNALFSLKSNRTTKHFTFKVQQQFNDYANRIAVSPPTWIVKVLNGPDNSRDYCTIGRIRDGHFAYNATNQTPAARGFAWCWKNLERHGERFEFHHAGRCGRCGRLLTVPSSIDSGIGPECQDKLAFEAMDGVAGLLDKLFGES